MADFRLLSKIEDEMSLRGFALIETIVGKENEFSMSFTNRLQISRSKEGRCTIQYGLHQSSQLLPEPFMVWMIEEVDGWLQKATPFSLHVGKGQLASMTLSEMCVERLFDQFSPVEEDKARTIDFLSKIFISKNEAVRFRMRTFGVNFTNDEWNYFYDQYMARLKDIKNVLETSHNDPYSWIEPVCQKYPVRVWNLLKVYKFD